MSRLKIRAALQTPIRNLGGPLADVNIASSAAGKIICAQPHGLADGVVIKVSGHSEASYNGKFNVKVESATVLVLRDMVREVPFKTVATGVGGVCAAQLTAWDNVQFNPVPSLPYQKVNVMFASPENPSFGGDHYREIGFMQVSLLYPIGLGTLDIETRAELIRATFPRGASFEKDGVTVHIPRTPEIMNGMPVDESYAIPIRIPFYADVFQ